MRTALLLCALAGSVVLTLTPVAIALPGDPPIELLNPADGADVAADLDGIAVSFTCPSYLRAGPVGPIFPADPGNAGDYGVELATQPAVSSNGRFTATIGAGAATPRPADPGTCDARVGSGDAPRPQTVPGTYYWLVYRSCLDCAGGYETSAVRSFVIRAAGRITLRAPARAYAGYPFEADTEGVVTGAISGEVLQRRVGGRWRELAPRGGDGALIASLPRGRHLLRAQARSGSDTITSAARPIVVVAARHWSTTGDDGAYGDPARPSVRLRVAGRGRRITGLRADVPTLCGSSSSPTGTTPNISRVELPAVRVAPDGRFALRARHREISVLFTGRLVARRLQGARLRVGAGSCVGSIAVMARRSG